MPHLREYIEDHSPRRIAINQSRTISMADGLTAELKEYLVDALGAPYRDRLVSSEPLVIDYASVHTPAEDAVEREASAATFALLRRALSNEVITPGRTTLMDVQYWITAEWKRQGFEFNFPASLELAAGRRHHAGRWGRPGHRARRPAARRLRCPHVGDRRRPAEDGVCAPRGGNCPTGWTGPGVRRVGARRGDHSRRDACWPDRRRNQAGRRDADGGRRHRHPSSTPTSRATGCTMPGCGRSTTGPSATATTRASP